MIRIGVFSRGLAPSSITIRASSTYHAKGGQGSALKQYVQHPKFVRSTLDYDYVLIETMEKLNFSETAQPIVLADSDVADGTKCDVTGWGILNSKKTQCFDFYQFCFKRCHTQFK